MDCKHWTIGIAGALLFAGSADAHHSGAMFDQMVTKTLVGTIREFQWTNPHCFIQLVVKDERGRDVEWSLEMTAPIHLMRLGWRRTSLKPGERITVTIHPLRNGEKGGNVVQALRANGKPIGAAA
jgi:hypothetical protein